MLPGPLILLIAFGYLGLLFALAYYAGERADAGRSLISSPYVYALSLAVYCTGWTFFGSVGRAAQSGYGFLPIYLGPTLMAALWWLVLRKIVRISKYHRLTSIADFVASRYGKSQALAALVTTIAVLGIVPYIALQLKAASAGYAVLSGAPEALPHAPFLADTAFYVALALALFTILFGTRHLDVTERHEGIVAAVAFESVVKLVAFVAVGLYVTYGLFDGLGDLFAEARRRPAIEALLRMPEGPSVYGEWFALSFLSMLAILFLPRQFQVAVVENVDEGHISKAMWLFPLYLLAINVFVLPIALAGLLTFSGEVNADTFVLSLPMAGGQRALALFAFVGGLSAATSMVIVATTALSTMICNDLVMPALLRVRWLRLSERRQLRGLLLGIRRGSIVGVLLLGYVYFRLIGGSYSLVSIGLISFAAVAQFGPAILGGIFWKRGTHAGALCGLVGGFLVWGYTLPLPSLVEAGVLPQSFIDGGPWGLALFKPYALFGLEGISPVPHALFWSLLVNAALYGGVSLFTRQSVIELSQARTFVDVFKYSGSVAESVWRGTAAVADLQQLLRRFLGRRTADAALQAYARSRDLPWDPGALTADADFVHHAEKMLAGAIGSASARVMVASVVSEEPLRLGEVMDILDEAQQTIAYSRKLESQSARLRRATRELTEANARLQELDELKDEFIATVTHELRTPLTSIRAFAEIMHDTPGLGTAQRQEFLALVIKESERLTRLINQVLTLQKAESAPAESAASFAPVDVAAAVREAAEAMSQHIEAEAVRLTLDLPPDGSPAAAAARVLGRHDDLVQVAQNLLSNAVKFCDADDGRVSVRLRADAEAVHLSVTDNGAGIDPAEQAVIFEKFRQSKEKKAAAARRTSGSGLGLTIVQRITAHHGGRVRVESTPGQGATFAVALPRLRASSSEEPSYEEKTPLKGAGGM